MNAVAVNLLSSYMIFVLFSMVLVSGWKPPPRQKRYPVCRTAECIKRGRYYFINMDLAGDPCKDFYQFVCGEWSIKRARPKFAFQWTVDHLLNIDALSNLRDLLRRPVRAGESEDEVTMKRIYHMCMSRNEMPKGDLQFVIRHISAIRYNQGNSVWNIHDEFLRLTGESAFFNVAYKADDNNTPLLQFKEIDSPYGSIYHVAEWNPAEERIYMEFLSKLLGMLNSMNIYSKRADEDKALLQKVVAFRHELNLIAKKSLSAPATDWAPATPAQMLKWYRKIAYMTESTQINWATIIRILYHNLSQDDMRTKPIITLRRKEYFITLALLLSKTPPRVLTIHMQLYFMERHLDYSKEMRKILESMFSGRIYTGRVREDVPRWMLCLAEHGMQLQLAKIYVKAFYPPIDQQYMQHMIDDMRDILKEDITKSWLYENTKKNTIRTLDHLKSAVGFPPWQSYLNDKISATEVLPMKPNAFYDPEENRMHLAPIAFASPMYEPGLPLIINIAGIGSIISRELYHMFGDCGTYRIEGSSEKKTWWPQKDQEMCEIKKQCFAQEYKRYAKKDFFDFIDPSQIDSRQTFEEDVADVMGLHLAYRYYKRKSKDVPHACQVLPELEDFTCDQLFFIAYANTMCAEISADYLSATYATANHNPRNLRVNGALRNHKPFSEAFGCRTRSPMNPIRKCNLWE